MITISVKMFLITESWVCSLVGYQKPDTQPLFLSFVVVVVQDNVGISKVSMLESVVMAQLCFCWSCVCVCVRVWRTVSHLTQQLSRKSGSLYNTKNHCLLHWLISRELCSYCNVWFSVAASVFSVKRVIWISPRVIKRKLVGFTSLFPLWNLFQLSVPVRFREAEVDVKVCKQF